MDLTKFEYLEDLVCIKCEAKIGAYVIFFDQLSCVCVGYREGKREAHDYGYLEFELSHPDVSFDVRPVSILKQSLVTP